MFWQDKHFLYCSNIQWQMKLNCGDKLNGHDESEGARGGELSSWGEGVRLEQVNAGGMRGGLVEVAERERGETERTAMPGEP